MLRFDLLKLGTSRDQIKSGYAHALQLFSLQKLYMKFGTWSSLEIEIELQRLSHIKHCRVCMHALICVLVLKTCTPQEAIPFPAIGQADQPRILVSELCM